MIQHAYLTSKLRGRAYLHAVQILNCLSVPGSDHPPLKKGNCPFSLFHGYDPDYSIFVAPWGSSCMVKSIGAKSSQLVPCSEYGILVNISSDCKSWEVYLPDKQKFVTTTHISVETDMSKRLALVEKFDLVLEQPGPMSTSAKAYAAGVRSLFSSSGLITPDLLIQLDPISRMPVKLVKFIDTDENTFLIPSDRIGDITDDGDSQTTADVGDLNPHMDDIGSAFIQYTALPANRSFPLPRPQLLSKAEKGMIKDAPDDVLLHWNDANPKIKNSFHRYAKYSKTKTLGEFRKNHRLVDLYNDLARGYVRLERPAVAVHADSVTPVIDTGGDAVPLSVLQHFQSLPDMWKSVCNTERVSSLLRDLDDLSLTTIINSSACQSDVGTSSVIQSSPVDVEIQNLSAVQQFPLLDGPSRCSKGDFIKRLAVITTDNYLKVENLIRAAEQRPLVDETDKDAEVLRHILTTPNVGEIFRSPLYNLSAAQSLEFPSSFKRAMERDDKVDWLRVSMEEWDRFYNHFHAMEPISYQEYSALQNKWDNTLDKPIPMKWVYCIKRHASTGLYNRHKARLVAAQSLHRYSIDDKWSPTLSLDTMRLMLVLACLHDADIQAIDVSGAYLSGKLDPSDPPIFMRPPAGLDEMGVEPKLPNGEKAYCYVAKSAIYGLQKACKLYLKSYFKFLSGFGLKQSSIDPCLWYRVDDSKNWILIGVYSDDNLIVGKGNLVKEFKAYFDSKYQESPDSGEVNPGIHEFLGIMVEKRKTRHGIIEIEMSSPKIMKKLRELCGDTPRHFVKNQLVEGIALNVPPSEDNPLISEKVFNCRSVFGICLWAGMAWRFDCHYGCARIASSLSKGNTQENMRACKQLAWYLLESDVQTLKFSSLNIQDQFSSFSDASHGNDLGTLRSWFSYLHVWGNAAFGGRTKLGTAICRSTKDSEIMAVIACLASMLGYRFMLHEIGFTQHNPTTIYIDATAALDQTTSMNIPRDQKFMAQRRGWVVAQFADGLARGVHCQTNYMMADANTKAHTVQRQIENARNLQGHGTIEVFSSVARHASKN